VVAGGEGRVVEHQHFHRVPYRQLERLREVERVPVPPIGGDRRGVDPYRDVDIAVGALGDEGAVEEGKHDFRPGVQEAPDRVDSGRPLGGLQHGPAPPPHLMTVDDGTFRPVRPAISG
jgi:hypothetical protein